MPVCSYKGCSNSSIKKFKMNSFPRNPIQLAKWIKNMDMKDWKYHKSAALCEVHFEPHMWEKIRVDGTKKLKFNAVPTIFGDRVVKETSILESHCENTNADSLQPAIMEVTNPIDLPTTSVMHPVVETEEANPAKRVPLNNGRKAVVQPKLTSILKLQFKANNSTVSTMTIPQDVLNQLKMANSKTPIIIPAPLTVYQSKIQTNSKSADNNQEVKESESSDSDTSATQTKGIILNKAEAKKMADERFKKMDNLLLKQLKLNDALRKKLISVNNKLQRLAKEEKIDHKTYLSDVFTDDQIRALELRHDNPKSITTWSYKTMIKAIKLKQECGTRGYEELLRQKMPLPSIRTISRWCTARDIPIP